ncbi:DUF4160 domain-containing protein [bacterium]|nr:DUF4160 domain-containing protein [bacterium]MBP5406344.1 DUF4160 domain-containing protein [bacterium]MBP5591640.1 DUF4160 domain-containing protein [bacterium]
MPEFLRAAGFKIYFWSNEKNEPIHFHITQGNPTENDTKIWVLSSGSFQLAHNKGRVSEKDLSRIFSAMQIYYFEFVNFWKDFHGGEVRFKDKEN